MGSKPMPKPGRPKTKACKRGHPWKPETTIYGVATVKGKRYSRRSWKICVGQRRRERKDGAVES